MANIDLDVRVIDKTQAALGNINKRVKGLDKSVAGINQRSSLLLKTLVAIGTGVAVRGIIQTTARFEDLRTTLTTVTGSAQAGAEAFDFISNFATKTQFGIEELSNAFIKLKAAGIEPTEELLTTFTDTAAITTDQLGSLEAVTDLFARTVGGGLGLEEIERLGDRGVPVLDILRDKLGLSRDQISEFGKSAEGARKIVEAFSEGIRERFGGATQNRVQNLSTRMSNLQIAVTNAADQFGQGFNVALGEAIVDITEFIEGNDKLIRQLGVDLGEAIGKSVDFIKSLRDEFELVKGVFDNIVVGFDSLPPIVKEVGIIGVLLVGKKGVVPLLVILGALGKINKEINGIAQTDFTIDPNLTGQKRVEAINDNLDIIQQRIKQIEDSDFGANLDFSVVTPGGTITGEDLGFTEGLTAEYNSLVAQQVELEKQRQMALFNTAREVMTSDKAYRNSLETQKQLGELRTIEIKDMPISNKLILDSVEAMEKFAESSESMIKVPVGTAAEENRKEYAKFQKQIKETEKQMRLIEDPIFNQQALFQRLKDTIPGLNESLRILDEELARIEEMESPFFEFGQHIGEQADMLKQLGRLSTQVYDQMADSLTDFVMTGKFNFADFSRFVIRELIKIAVQAAITFAIKSAAGAFGIPIPGLASGGPAEEGRPYIVGEKGPELFVPGSTGRIVPNDQLKNTQVSSAEGGDNVVINFNITATDAASFDDLLVSRRSTIVGIINEGMNRQGKRSII